MKPSASRPIVTPGRAASLRRPAPQTPKIIVASGETNATDANNPFMTRGEVAAATAAGIAAAKENGIALRQVNGVIPEGDEDEDPYSTDKPPSERRHTSETVRTATSNLTARPRPNGDADATRNTEEEEEARSKRFSTSSKFREIGLDSTDDLSTIGQRRDSRHDDYGDYDVSRSLSRPYSMTSPADYAARLERGGRTRREEELAEEDRRIIREGRGRQTWWTEWLCGCGRVIDDDNEQVSRPDGREACFFEFFGGSETDGARSTPYFADW
ncbi:hypothetical protein BCV69DRAFT_171144 [Microstroma glucosiphilum]|uniref:Uncharacterized protein n=1 Tax=Pseudomicrostroma glucosiphilum TaxID=1684307 RepID=A0A316U8H9_9BASI|nr:hypothetical protein BCV69DRAFT_171144 [Pseudomicrostroma glucosiphilum]PWN21472.1 hypothetical protein BCV69DRAFT_171144 [Pseudomicrostroma glucosiphilum]